MFIHFGSERIFNIYGAFGSDIFYDFYVVCAEQFQFINNSKKLLPSQSVCLFLSFFIVLADLHKNIMRIKMVYVLNVFRCFTESSDTNFNFKLSDLFWVKLQFYCNYYDCIVFRLYLFSNI